MSLVAPTRLALAATAAILFVLALALALALAPAGALAAGVSVDRSFGAGGTATPALGPAFYPSAFSSIAPQGDGTLLVGRREGAEPTERFARFGATGQPVAGPVPESTAPHPEATQPDGKVLKLANGEAFERLDPDGTRDPSFGTQDFGTGRVSDNVGFAIEAIAVEPSGAILVAGTKFHSILSGAPPEPEQVVEQLCAARLDSSGRLDPTFGTGGVVHLHTDLGFAGEKLLGIAARPGGGAVLIDVDTEKPVTNGPYAAPGSYLVGLDAAGALDPGYGNGGEVRLGAEITKLDSLPGGSLLVAGDLWSPTAGERDLHSSDLLLARYGDDGRPEPGFAGGAPAATADFGGIDVVNSLLVEADGSILLGGATTPLSANCAYYEDFCTETPVLARFTAAGIADLGFGSGGHLALGALTEPYVGVEGRGVEALAPRPGGGLLVGGGSGPLAFLAALSPAGALDPGFGTAGVATQSEPHASRSGAHAIAVDGGGRILVGGGTDAGLSMGAPEGAVFRLLAGGGLDPSFGGAGFARVPHEASALAVQGSTILVLSNADSAISRLTDGGDLDPAFGREGTVEPGVDAPLRSIAALRGGGVLVAGTRYGGKPRAEVLRLTASGARDRAFGTGGLATLTFGYRHRCGVEAIAVEPDGRILVAGFVVAERRHRPEERLAVMRLRVDGAPDRSFGRGGLLTTRLGPQSRATAIAVQANSRILVAGRSGRGANSKEVLLKLTPAGELDPDFGRGGITLSQAPIDPKNPGSVGGAEPRQILVTASGYVVARTGPGRPLVGYEREGRLEPGFARGAVAAESRELGSPAVAMRSGKLLVVRDVRKTEAFQVQRLLLH
jgi:uncharacterized delta-60 repeat protein